MCGCADALGCDGRVAAAVVGALVVGAAEVEFAGWVTEVLDAAGAEEAGAEGVVGADEPELGKDGGFGVGFVFGRFGCLLGLREPGDLSESSLPECLPPSPDHCPGACQPLCSGRGVCPGEPPCLPVAPAAVAVAMSAHNPRAVAAITNLGVDGTARRTCLTPPPHTAEFILTIRDGIGSTMAGLLARTTWG